MDDVRRYDDREAGYFLEDLAVGMSASFSKTLTDADIVMFSGVSGDTNPVHLDEEYAKDTIFEGRISHGMLSAGFISAVLGTKLPGPAASTSARICASRRRSGPAIRSPRGSRCWRSFRRRAGS